MRPPFLVLQTGAQIGLDHLLVGFDLGQRAFRQHFALGHTDHRIAEAPMKSMSCSITTKV